MAKKKKKKKGSADAVVAEFGHKDAKSGGGGGARVPEGDYKAKIIKAKKGEAKSSGNTMITWTLKITEGKYKGKKIVDRTVLQPNSLFRLRNLLECLGVDVPDKTVKVKYAEYVGEEVGITVTDGEPYKNKIKSEVAEYIPVDQVDEDDEDDEDEDDDDLDEDDEDSDEDDDDEDDEDEDLDEVDLDEL